MHVGDTTHQQIRVGLQASRYMDYVLEQHSPVEGHFVLPGPAADDFKISTNVYVNCLVHLEAWFDRNMDQEQMYSM